MQQMNSEQINGEWQNQYRGYEGDMQYDEQFRINEDALKLNSGASNSSLSSYRLLLAVISVCALVLVFALLMAALAFGHISSGGSIALGWGMVAVCGTIMAVNGYFNSASKTCKQAQKGKK